MLNFMRMFVSRSDKDEWFHDCNKGFNWKALHLFTNFSSGLSVLKVQNFTRIFASCFDKVEWFFLGK